MVRPGPLRVAPFPRLLVSYFFNELGDVFGALALAVLVYDETGSALATAGLFVATRFLPALVAPAFVARIDQLSTRRTLAGLYVAEAAVFALLALTSRSFFLPAVLALGLLDGTLALTARSLSRGAVAATLGTGEALRDGNALLNIAFALASVGGAVAAGALVAATSVEVALWCDAVSFALVALLMATCKGLPATDEPREAMLSRLKDGLRHVRRSPLLRTLLGLQALAFVLFTLSVPVEVVYAKETLDAGDFGFGVLLAAWGAGILIGSAVFAVARRLDVLIVAGAATGLVGVGYLGMGLVRDLAPAAAFAAVGGAGNGVQWVSVMTLIQQRTPDALQTRIAGLLESLGAAMPGVGFLLGGVLTSLTSAPTTFVTAGIGLLVLAAVGAVMALRLRRRPEGPSGAA